MWLTIGYANVWCASTIANINDRSMTGIRDSEVAMRIVDTDVVETTMYDEPWRAGRFAHNLRMYGRWIML